MARQFNEIRDDMLQSAVLRGIANYTGNAGVAKNLIEVLAYETSVSERSVGNAVNQAFVTDASGLGLDRHGADLFRPRRIARRATSPYTDLNVRLSVANGTFSSNSVLSSDISIGMRLTNAAGNKAFVVKAVQTLGDFDNASEIFVSVQAIQSGSAGNIGQRTLTVHSVDSVQLLVTNLFPISNGRDAETDAEYKANLQNQILSLEACNDAAVRRNTFSVAGIGKVNIITGYAGAGTIGIIVQPTLGIVAVESLLSAIRDAVLPIVPHGTSLTVKAPVQLQLSIETLIRTTTPLNVTEQNVLQGRVERVLTSYFNQFQIGEDFSQREMSATIKGVDPRITGFGADDQVVDVVRYSIGDAFSTYESRIRLNRLVLDEDEIIVLSSSPYNISIV